MKQKILIFVNIGLLLAFLTVLTSILIYDIIPSSLNGDEIVGEIHEIAGMIFSLLAITHISLNWRWIKTQILKQKGGKK